MKKLTHAIRPLLCGFALLLGAQTLNAETSPAAPPREPTYKPRYKGEAPLSAADIRGPDGLVYPDWRSAGVPGGIPQVAVALDLADRGARDGMEISAMLQAAVDEVGAQGGGAILIGPGTYYLDLPVTVTHDGVVIRGSGMDETRLVFRFRLRQREIRLTGFTPREDFETLEVMADPEGLAEIAVYGDDKEISVIKADPDNWGNRFFILVSREKAINVTGPGSHEFRVVTTYSDGKTAQKQQTLTVSPTPVEQLVPVEYGAIVFTRQSHPFKGDPKLFTADGLRGSKIIELENGHGLVTGDYIEIQAPPSADWNATNGNVNTADWAVFRANMYQVAAVDGNRVTLDLPLRLDFPAADGSFARKTSPVRFSGVENLTLEQTQNLWIDGIAFAWTWGCWARDVKVKNTGRHPIFFLDSKHGEVRDCIYDDALFKGTGGSAYGGVQRSYDCLLENLTTYNLRHAPIFNWACSGNVVRNSRFYGSDMHWHAGWCNQNLVENCLIDATDKRYGMVAVGPIVHKLHGPQGPLNVIYHCDVRVLRGAANEAGIYLMGQNEHWLFVYNRFMLARGFGMELRDGSFDNIVKGNVFCIERPGPYLIELRDANCVGTEIIDNKIYGDVQSLTSGDGQPAKAEGNEILPYTLAPLPTPPVESIFLWQREVYQD